MFAFIVLAYLTIIAIVASAHWRFDSTAVEPAHLDLPLEVFVTTTTTIVDTDDDDLHVHPAALTTILTDDTIPLITTANPTGYIPTRQPRNALLSTIGDNLGALLVYVGTVRDPIDLLTATTLTTDPHTLTYEERDVALGQARQLKHALKSAHWRLETMAQDMDAIIEWLDSRRDNGWTNSGWGQ